MPLTGEIKLEIIKLFYANQRSTIQTYRDLVKKRGEKLRNLNLRTISRVVKKFETQLTLQNQKHEGRPKTTDIDKNIEKVMKTLKKAPVDQFGLYQNQLKCPGLLYWR